MVGAVLCVIRGLAASLGSMPWVPGAPPLAVTTENVSRQASCPEGGSEQSPSLHSPDTLRTTALYKLIYSSQQPSKVGHIIVLILWKEKLRHREVK